jgi:predicted MFS family arabinose efflux permease
MFTLTSAISSAAGGWLLDSTSLGISGIIWWMAGLMVIPGVLWYAWITFGKTSAPKLSEEEITPTG